MVGDVTGPEGYRIFLPRQLSTPTKNGKVIKSTILSRIPATYLYGAEFPLIHIVVYG